MIRPLKQAADDLAETALVGVAGREKLGRARVVVSMSKSTSKPAHVLKNEPKPSAAGQSRRRCSCCRRNARVAVNAVVNTAPIGAAAALPDH